jgi:hypothetical protein
MFLGTVNLSNLYYFDITLFLLATISLYTPARHYYFTVHPRTTSIPLYRIFAATCTEKISRLPEHTVSPYKNAASFF